MKANLGRSLFGILFLAGVISLFTSTTVRAEGMSVAAQSISNIVDAVDATDAGRDHHHYQHCVGRCERHYNSCRHACGHHNRPCKDRCEREYRHCVRHCRH